MGTHVRCIEPRNRSINVQLKLMFCFWGFSVNNLCAPCLKNLPKLSFAGLTGRHICGQDAAYRFVRGHTESFESKKHNNQAKTNAICMGRWGKVVSFFRLYTVLFRCESPRYLYFQDVARKQSQTRSYAVRGDLYTFILRKEKHLPPPKKCGWLLAQDAFAQ